MSTGRENSPVVVVNMVLTAAAGTGGGIDSKLFLERVYTKVPARPDTGTHSHLSF